jgi:acylphosphatase
LPRWGLSEAIEARVSGRVQAVGYREFCRRAAQSLGIYGWARNEPDGSVLVHAEGTPEALERFSERLREGPHFARVDEVVLKPVEPQGLDGFDVGW